MKTIYLKQFSLLIIALFSLVSCSHYILPDEEESEILGDDATANLHVRVSEIELLPMGTTNSRTMLESLCSQLSFALFNMDGTKIGQTVTQKQENESFGSVNIRTKPGQFILITVGHNGEGNCTITSPQKVTFSNNKVTDTFTSCDTLTIKEGSQEELIKITRRVAMVRLIQQEAINKDVAKLQFYYTGGSSTLDASTGYGCVASRQTEYRDIPPEAYEGPGAQFDIYTIPRENSNELNLTIRALDAEEQILSTQTFTVPIKVGYMLKMNGSIGSDSSKLNVTLTIDNYTWKTEEYWF